MDYNTPDNLAACSAIVDQAKTLLYYSHIPASILAILVGVFVFIKNKGSLISKILFSIAISFSLWTTIDLLVWINYDKNTLIMFLWTFFGILYALIYVLSLYFVYVFIDKEDISLLKKIILGTLLLPVIFFSLTSYNLEGFDVADCVAIEGKYYTNYYYLLGLMISFWIIVLAVHRYRKAEGALKEQIVLLTIGIELFLFSFFTSGFLASYLIENGYINGGNYGIEQYGLFGMPIFLGFLAYFIVKYKAFDIKVFAAQALVAAMVILIGSQFFFIRSTTNRILTGITFLLTSGFGYVLVRSVKLEIQRKEELQMITEELAVANDRLRKLDNAKSEFISIASHQLRTPLTAIKGYLSLLLEGSYGKIKPDHKDVIDKVYQSNERLIELVEDLLNLSRIESGRMEYDYSKFDVLEVCRELYDTFVLRAKDKNIGLTLENLPGQSLEVTSDRGKIREIISNLIDNAIKYTAKGEVRVFASPEEGFVKVAITDSGIGVPKSELPFLFQKFSRGKDISRLNTGGTGLGLHVGKSMVEAMGGRIGVDSEGEGKGSVFWIEIPVKAKKTE